MINKILILLMLFSGNAQAEKIDSLQFLLLETRCIYKMAHSGLDKRVRKLHLEKLPKESQHEVIYGLMDTYILTCIKEKIKE